MKIRSLSVVGLRFFLMAGLSGQVGAFDEKDLENLLTGTPNCWKCDLRQADLSSVDLSEAMLWRANLTRANLRGAILWNASLEETNLREADLSNADIRGAILWKANLTGANLTEAKLNAVDMTRANLEGAKNFDTADTTGAIFCGTTMPDGKKNRSGCWRLANSSN